MCEKIDERPELNVDLDSGTFLNFYYLKEELVQFCRENRLPTSGGKIELTERVAKYLDTGIISAANRNTKRNIQNAGSKKIITKETKIEENFVCSETHRAFFLENVGKSFSFNVAFQKWLKTNSGKTYEDAINAYFQIIQDKKKTKTSIDSQFEYNTYIRDFFENNKGRTLADAIKCWKFKKSLQGHNRYEDSDLTALK